MFAVDKIGQSKFSNEGRPAISPTKRSEYTAKKEKEAAFVFYLIWIAEVSQNLALLLESIVSQVDPQDNW